jgi:tellurite resistance protein
MTFTNLFGNQGGSVSEVEARAYIEIMLILAVADGGFAQEEMLLLTQVAKRHPRITGLGEAMIEQLVDSSLKDMVAQGAEARIRAIAELLPHQGQRIEALTMGLAMAAANGDLHPTELTILDKFQTVFGLSDNQVRQILGSLGSL